MTNSEIQDLEKLNAFIGDGLITEIVAEVKRGKEATVYCCRAAESTGRELLAAKIYRPIEHRAFRNDAIYQPGHDAALNRRDRLAMAKKSRHGRGVQLGIWLHAEYDTLRMLHAAGADVPEPVASADGALLMEFIGDGDGAAPMLSRVELGPDEARQCLRRILDNVALWLRYDRVHGDLSPYNVLYRDGAPVVIDFPQSVDPRMNPNAHELLFRDVENICGFFARFGVRAEPRRIAGEFWLRYRVGEL
jgi:RIO kinase 1